MSSDFVRPDNVLRQRDVGTPLTSGSSSRFCVNFSRVFYNVSTKPLTRLLNVSVGPGNMTAAMSKFSSLYDGDTLRIFLLIFLYVLQGIPLGIGSSIPYLLQARKVRFFKDYGNIE